MGKANDIKVTAIKSTEYCDLGYREQWDIKDHSLAQESFLSGSDVKAES